MRKGEKIALVNKKLEMYNMNLLMGIIEMSGH